MLTTRPEISWPRISPAGAVVRPRIEEVFDDVQLEPRHLPEKVAQKKIVDELLDHAVTVGRLDWKTLRLLHTPRDTTDGLTFTTALRFGRALGAMSR